MTHKESLNFDASDKTIGEVLFSNFAYRVPPYQRPYSWEDDEISDFWNDLALNSGSYFLGSLIFNYENIKKDGVIEIIDGQQRLLTITIMLAVIRDVFKEIGEIKIAELIQRKTIAIEDDRGKMINRISCGESTQDCF